VFSVRYCRLQRAALSWEPRTLITSSMPGHTTHLDWHLHGLCVEYQLVIIYPLGFLFLFFGALNLCAKSTRSPRVHSCYILNLV
jgi:hypothetical protein